jgi:hypothetical protein
MGHATRYPEKRGMTRIWRIPLLIGAALGCYGLLLAQKPFKQYHVVAEPANSGYPLPPNWDQPGEWIFGRLKYADTERFLNRENYYWSMDYPPGDRHLLEGVRRLTSINVRPVEQVIELDGTDDVYNWPFLYGVEVGFWDLNVAEAGQLRDFLLRGGFLMVDDFHGPPEWEQFEYGMKLVFPDRQIVDLDQGNTIFHLMSDVDISVQVPSAGSVARGVTYEKGGVTPRWRGVLDDNGRVMVAICHNMDLGDAIEWSDNPQYPERYAQIAYRVLINYVMYDLTH